MTAFERQLEGEARPRHKNRHVTRPSKDEDFPETPLSRIVAAAEEAEETARRVAWCAQLQPRNVVDPEKARAKIRKAGPPRSTLRRWGWALEPVAADLPRNSRWRIFALADCAELRLDRVSLTEVVLKLCDLVGDDWISAGSLLQGIHVEVDARISQLIALDAMTPCAVGDVAEEPARLAA